ncbi:MAG TPA: hypothetical protein VGM03_08840 [Phycisphaerae bacterium]|jgi:hypothetical protein
MGSPRLSIILMMGFVVIVPAACHAQLYGDEGKNVTTGDLNSQDYWWAKFDNMMLELAIKQHQPEGRIGFNLVSSIKRLDELAKKYPKHEDIKKWKQRAEEVQAKIDPNADRKTPLSPECPWEESNFAQIWVNLQWAQMLYDAHDYEQTLSLLQNVEQNLDIMLKPDRMKDYPEDLRKWVQDAKPKADELRKKTKEKTNR